MKIEFDPGWVECHDCKMFITESKDLNYLLDLVNKPCPVCGSHLMTMVRPPKWGKCDGCGRRVELDAFTCPCECGCDYNMDGWLLTDRAQWGEETGETAADILTIP
jgi:hypothetical protein